MKEEKDITIFICENKEVSHEIIDKYMEKGKVNYAEIIPAKNRQKVIDFLQIIEEPFLKLDPPNTIKR